MESVKVSGQAGSSGHHNASSGDHLTQLAPSVIGRCQSGANMGRGVYSVGEGLIPIRDFPDHATFRGKGAKLACADKLGVFLSLTLCKRANFEYLSFIK